MSGFVLKIIACIAMLLDHIAIIFNIAILPFRAIGRIAFPIYAFFIVEGYFKTSNVKKYKMRLIVVALISELPRKLFIRNLSFDKFVEAFLKDPIPTLFINNGINAIFTLFIGLVLIDILSKINRKYDNCQNQRKKLIIAILSAISIVTACVVAVLINSDYSYIGILMIVVFYYFKNNSLRLAFGFGAITLFDLIMSFFVESEPFVWCLISLSKIAVLIPLFVYNGMSGLPQKQTSKKFIQWSFYLFYPLHLLILYLISIIV